MPLEIGQLPQRIIDDPSRAFPFPISRCQMTSKSQPQRVIAGERNKIGRFFRNFSDSPESRSPREKEREKLEPTDQPVLPQLVGIIEHVRGSSVLTDGSVITVIPTSLELLCHVNPFVIARPVHRTVLMRCSRAWTCPPARKWNF